MSDYVLPGMEEAAEPVIDLDRGTDPIPRTFEGELEPVDLIHVQHHKFVKRGKGGPKSPGCEVCRAGKTAMDHWGAPPSLNAQGSSANRFIYQAQKQAWQEMWTRRLRESSLPARVGSVYVEGQICFPDRAKRDQGNFRHLIEKSCGDALVSAHYLEDDDWDHFEFGRLRREYQRGVSWTALTLYPRM